jgi:hypothetical protein
VVRGELVDLPQQTSSRGLAKTRVVRDRSLEIAEIDARTDPSRLLPGVGPSLEPPLRVERTRGLPLRLRDLVRGRGHQALEARSPTLGMDRFLSHLGASVVALQHPLRIRRAHSNGPDLSHE